MHTTTSVTFAISSIPPFPPHNWCCMCRDNSWAAFVVLSNLDRKQYEKILYTIRKAQTKHDPALLKKLYDEIWEFRTIYQRLQIRLLAFWDKTNFENTLVVTTHGFIMKQSKVPENEIQKAKQLRAKYFEDKEKLKKKKK